MTELASHDEALGDLDAARTVMWEMITGYRVSQVVRVVAALSLAEHCANGPVTAKSLVQGEGADQAAVSRFPRACASAGLRRVTVSRGQSPMGVIKAVAA